MIITHPTASPDPRWGWMAYDDDKFDGAPDAGRQIVGYGRTKEDALADYREQCDD